jgi:MoaA/NifB/PqqE/SkfB family radical SAM enzyme
MCMVAFARGERYSSLEKVADFTDRPRWAYVVICDNCSHHCAWCYGGFDQDLDGAMPPAAFAALMEKMRAIGVRQVTLAGGEPTEHPEFREIVRIADELGFLIHVASHGEHIDEELAGYLARHHVRQVQLNFQGRRAHDAIHGVAGSHEKQRAAIAHLQAAGIEVTTTTVVGRYNIRLLDEVLGEAAELGVDRLRVWESTGRGNPWRKDLEAVEIFEAAQATAEGLGYGHSLSYDPQFEGDATVACPQLSNLFLYITHRGILRFCGAVVGGAELEIIDCNEATPEEILAAYLAYNARVLAGRRPWCPARLGMDPDQGPAAPDIRRPVRHLAQG